MHVEVGTTSSPVNSFATMALVNLTLAKPHGQRTAKTLRRSWDNGTLRAR